MGRLIYGTNTGKRSKGFHTRASQREIRFRRVRALQNKKHRTLAKRAKRAHQLPAKLVSNILNEQYLWKIVLADSETSIKNVYSATFFARRNISIIDQQIRSFNLCYGLSESGRLKKSRHVAIIGCGVSGMTCAVALAVLHDCIVSVFECETTLLRKFREAAFRYIHPDLNHRGSRDIDLSYEPRKKTNFAFMNWSGNYAPLVAEELEQKFEHYRHSTNIALHLGEEVIAIRSTGEKVKLELNGKKSATFDLAIIASGFGAEKRDENTNDDSYWHSGNPRGYQPIASRKSEGAKERILISGNGDSGVIELAHFLISDFSHRDIFNYLPLNDIAPYLARSYAYAVENLGFREIEGGNPNYPDFSGPMSWYWGIRELTELNPGLHLIDNKNPTGKAEQAIYDLLHSHLASHDLGKKIRPSIIEAIEREVDPMLDELASDEIGQLVNNYKLKKIYADKIKRMFQNSFQIKVLGGTPLIYSRRQAPLNWFLLKVLEEYGTFEYQRAKLIRTDPKAGLICAMLELPNKTKIAEEFDRIVVRHGPDFNVLGYKKNTRIRPKKPHSDYRFTDNIVIGWTLNARKKKYYDAFIEYFRTSRWKQAVRAAAPFDDSCLTDRLFNGSISGLIVNPDSLLLMLCTAGRQDIAGKLYRKIKAAKTVTTRLDVLQQMLKLSSKFYVPKISISNK